MTAQEEKTFIKKHLCSEPPEPCDFKVNDIVIFTNDYGVSFPGRKVIGFSKKGEVRHTDCFVHLSGDTPYWFGISPKNIKK